MTRPPSSDEVQHRFVGLPRDDGALLHRVDGWVASDPDYPDRCIPPSVAALMAKAMPDFEVRSSDVTAQVVRSLGANSIRDIKQRALSRQAIYERNRRLGPIPARYEILPSCILQ